MDLYNRLFHIFVIKVQGGTDYIGDSWLPTRLRPRYAVGTFSLIKCSQNKNIFIIFPIELNLLSLVEGRYTIQDAFQAFLL